MINDIALDEEIVDAYGVGGERGELLKFWAEGGKVEIVYGGGIEMVLLSPTS
jgi:hypothetical protein